jgi:hypothetical protein
MPVIDGLRLIPQSRGMPSLRSLLLPGLEIKRSRTGSGANDRDFSCSRTCPRNSAVSTPIGDGRRADPVHSDGPRTLVTAHPVPRYGEKIRVMNEVEHIINATAGIIDRPVVQLALHLPYPPGCPRRVRP